MVNRLLSVLGRFACPAFDHVVSTLTVRTVTLRSADRVGLWSVTRSPLSVQWPTEVEEPGEEAVVLQDPAVHPVLQAARDELVQHRPAVERAPADGRDVARCLAAEVEVAGEGATDRAPVEEN